MVAPNIANRDYVVEVSPMRRTAISNALKEKGFKKQVFDLEMRPSGIVRRVIEYRAARVRCTECNRAFYPPLHGIATLIATG